MMLRVRSYFESDRELFAFAVFGGDRSHGYCNFCYSEEFSDFGFDRLESSALAGGELYVNAQKYFVDRKSLLVSGVRYTAFSLELCRENDRAAPERVNPLAVISTYTSGTPTKQVLAVASVLDRLRSGDRSESVLFREGERSINGSESAAFSAGSFLCALHVARSLFVDRKDFDRVEIGASKDPNSVSVSVSSERSRGELNEFLVNLLYELSARGGFSVNISSERVLFSFARVNLSGLPLSAYNLRDVDLAMLLLFGA